MHADKRCLVIVTHPQLAKSRVNAERLRVAGEHERATRPRAEWLNGLLTEAGARPVPLDAERHDRLTGAAQVLTRASSAGQALGNRGTGDRALCARLFVCLRADEEQAEQQEDS